MLAIRLNTAIGLLLTGVLLTATALVLLSHPLLTHSGLVGTLLTSDANHRGAEGTGAAGCHEESAPRDQAPANHDCCLVGHLRAIGSALVIIAPAFAVSPISSSFVQAASIEQEPSQTREFSDSGPPGSALPIRV